MPSIIKKIKNGHSYYYAAQSKRVKGKPRIVWQKYLGTVDSILKRCEENLAPLPTETVLFEAGGVAALLSIASQIGLLELINEIVPKRNQGPSVGHFIILAAINRVLDPLSKSKIGDWYHKTILQRIWKFPSDVFHSKRFWDHMDMISEDDIEKIQNFLAERIRKEFKIDTQPLLYDTTNFFTYIDTYNNRNTIAKRGRNKQKRSDLRQVNLALLATPDFQIPLFHKTYEGDVPDVKFFPEIVKNLLRRHSIIFGNLNDTTLVFDKGNFTEEMMQKLLYSETYFVAGIKAKVLPEIFSQPIEQFQDALKISGTKFYTSTVEIFGRICQVIVCYSESFFTQQLASLTATMTKCQDRLKNLHNYLLSWTEEKKPKGTRPTLAKVKARLKEILSSQHMNKVFKVSVEVFEEVPYLHYSIDRDELNHLTSTHLGRTLLITNRKDWLPIKVISTYRSLESIEEAFKQMKNRDYLRWQPAFHWTDQKIKVHSFYCVLALLLASLARKKVWEAGIEISLPALLDNLSAIKEVALLYSQKNGKVKAQFTLNKMSPRQKKLADLFKISEILIQG